MDEESGGGEQVSGFTEQRHMSVPCGGTKTLQSADTKQNPQRKPLPQTWKTSLFRSFKNRRHAVVLQLCYCDRPETLTHLQAVERKCVLSDKLVIRRGVIVLDDEADERQLWHVHVELEVLIPSRVKTFNTEAETGHASFHI